MSANNVLDTLMQKKIVAIVRGVLPKDMARLAQALLDGGISCMEVTYDHRSEQGIRNTLESISILHSQFGDRLALGAGTVLTPLQVDTAVDAGATFIISPNTDTAVIKRTKERGAISMPGALTPSEVVTAWNAGADIVKLFPAGELGAGYIKAVKAPLAHIPLSAVGGVTPENLCVFFAAGVCGVGVGGNLVNLSCIKKGDFDSITAVAKQFSDALAAI